MSTTNRALIVIDVQQEYFDGPLEIQYPPRDESRAQILRAIDVADEAGIPVVIVQHDRTVWSNGQRVAVADGWDTGLCG